MKNWISNRYHGIVFGRTRIGEFLNALHSLRLFLKYSFRNAHTTEKDSLKAFLIKQYHIVEKGMALPNPRKNFGIPKIMLLLDKMEQFEIKYGVDQNLYLPIRKCLKEYMILNPNLSSANKKLASRLVSFIGDDNLTSSGGGTKFWSASELRQATAIDFENFVQSRSSVRDFKLQRVEVADVKRAVDIARHAPSVCNRQNWQLHYYDDPEIKTKLLNLQHGNGGFTDSIQGLFVVTTNLKGFTRMEQNQVFTDGGIISMNLVLALHHLGIGSCCLNTCFPYTRENKIKKIGNIPQNERLIMMVGIGYWKEEFKVAYSLKKSVEQILKVHS